jgi:very-short-patch-repair endonuclease
VESVGDVLARQGGWATAAEVVAATSRRALAAALSRGEVERLALGIYVLPGLSADKLTAIAYDGVVSHQSAALAWDLPLLVAPPKPHITLPANRRPRPGPPAVLHWSAIATEDRRNRTTSLLRTVLDCARTLPFAEALAVADAALGSGLLGQEELVTATTSMRGPGRPDARKVAELATRQSGSFLESMLRALLITEGITGFEPQVLVTNGRFRARVDLGHRQAQLALEADGYEFHGSRRDFAADCRRYDELVAAGWLVLRLTYEQVVGDPAWVVATVRQALAARLDVPLDRR